MKSTEAIQSGLYFRCPHNGCKQTQPFKRLVAHITAFHHWRHASVDAWAATLSLADGLPEQDQSDRKPTSEKDRPLRRATPPAPKERVEEPDRGNVLRIIPETTSGFSLGVIARIVRPA